MKKGHLPSLLSPETDRILFRNPSNNIPKIILMIDDPVKHLPSSFLSPPYLYTMAHFTQNLLFYLCLNVFFSLVYRTSFPCAEVSSYCAVYKNRFMP